ncbi:MAG: NAD(P)-dependent glycerol-3-phosphate dehydrogenase [Bacilli bacterium]|nr:NAD(P)-dependent glycerol-3-phosphate dehydrogenase [Bacilli bacterium]MDD3304751.1 NAD(P)-dependent glycerol-3-phosphate dehydrogenase [Bacilli bacterium]MDD4053720.1 NAD(P)-dependent glycerol-3-phosphate dehydrogenase [Bacilli bacterium]MDD4411591.1 NAD(P)-dependent glycerol-3-phosphate dehydrogenase [Bacilli bacterium]
MKIAFLGTGAFGLSNALMASENNHEIMMWTKFEEEKEILIKNSGNSKLLPNIVLPSNIKYTTDMEECVAGSDLIMIMVPAGFVDSVSIELKKYYKDQYICIGSKGIEQDTCLFVDDVVRKQIKTKKLAVISGPSFAVDLASYVPIGLTLASEDKKTAKVIKEALENKYLKIRTCDDILGVEICGSIKNIIAIACGMVDGMGLPESTQAMLITESMHDIKQLIHALGGDKKTILSYAGIGDLILTCTSTKSRNFSFGQLIGSKAPQEEIDAYINNTTIEGLYTLKSIYKLLKNKHVDMPIIDIMYDIIIEKQDITLLPKFLIEKD